MRSADEYIAAFGVDALGRCMLDNLQAIDARDAARVVELQAIGVELAGRGFDVGRSVLAAVRIVRADNTADGVFPGNE